MPDIITLREAVVAIKRDNDYAPYTERMWSLAYWGDGSLHPDFDPLKEAEDFIEKMRCTDCVTHEGKARLIELYTEGYPRVLNRTIGTYLSRYGRLDGVCGEFLYAYTISGELSYIKFLKKGDPKEEGAVLVYKNEDLLCFLKP